MKDYYTNDTGWQVGDRVKVFDHLAWSKNGGDAGDNEIFMRPATVTEIYVEKKSEYTPDRPRTVAEIEWDHNEYRHKKSRGHFLYAMRRI